MSEPGKEPTIIGAIWGAATWLAKRELVIRIFTVLVLIGCGAAGLAVAQDKFDGGVDKRVAPLEAALAAKVKADNELHAKQATERTEDRAEIATVKLQSAETMLNMRLVVESLKLKPIILVESQDGGR